MKNLQETLGSASEGSSSAKHNYMRNKWKGTKEIQEIRKAMLEKSKPVVTHADFRKKELP